jgi:hypothetical protein
MEPTQNNRFLHILQPTTDCHHPYWRPENGRFYVNALVPDPRIKGLSILLSTPADTTGKDSNTSYSKDGEGRRLRDGTGETYRTDRVEIVEGEREVALVASPSKSCDFDLINVRKAITRAECELPWFCVQSICIGFQ